MRTGLLPGRLLTWLWDGVGRGLRTATSTGLRGNSLTIGGSTLAGGRNALAISGNTLAGGGDTLAGGGDTATRLRRGRGWLKRGIRSGRENNGWLTIRDRDRDAGCGSTRRS